MRTITKNVYTFDELSDKSKQKVFDFFRETEDYFLLDEILQDKLSFLFPGFEKLSYSLGYSQGDGFSFTGGFSGKEIKTLLTLIDPSYKTPSFIDNLYMNITRINYHYSHERSVETEIDFNDYNHEITEKEEKIISEIKSIIENYRIKTCKELEKIGYNYIEELKSEEYIIENINLNEYEFYSNGELIEVELYEKK